MSIKIAVGSSDGVVIDQHFGSGKKFYVFELLEGGSIKLIDTREVKTEIENFVPTSLNENTDSGCNSGGNSGCGSVSSGCGTGGSSCHSNGHDEQGLIGRVNLLSDCQAVLVNQIGKGAEKLLLKNGIGAFEAKNSIEKAFSKIYIYYKRTKQIS